MEISFQLIGFSTAKTKVSTAQEDTTIMASLSDSSSSSLSSSRSLVVATRLHLGNAKEAPSQEQVDTVVSNFASFAWKSCHAAHAVIAVDCQERIPDYDYVHAVQQAVHQYCFRPPILTGTTTTIPKLRVLPVTPWDKFTPALNALIGYAAVECRAQYILFVSAETSAAEEAIQQLMHHMTPTTLAAGALLPGHDYQHDILATTIPLNGRTTPWNTLAVWNISKLALTGFPLVADGLHLQPDGSRGSAGVEEVAAIALLQRVLGPSHAQAKLVKLQHVEWNQTFEDDERRKWHETKMKSKLERATAQLELLQLEGTVQHL